MKKTILILLAIIGCSSVYAQRETFTWFFGRNTGMDFNVTTTMNHPTYGLIDNIPTLLPNGPINTAEGCFSISGKDGSLILASDGRTVYNKKLQKMAPTNHVLKGHDSATSSGIVVPIPGTIGKYYVISAPWESSRVGFFYNIVDLGLQNGDGELTSMNIPISMAGTGYTAAAAPENITVVGHTNGRDYWLACRMRNKFVVWAVTDQGISSTPKAYTVNKDLNLSSQGMGYIKFSPDGKKLVHADYTEGNLSYADFDPSTGIITKPYSVKSNLLKLYGVEFSDSGEYLYLTSIQTSVPSQHGLYIIKTSDLPYTGTTITLPKKVDLISNVQLGKGNRIYCISQYDTAAMWIILNPNEGGTKVVKINNYFTNPAQRPWLGLPPFITSFFTVEKISGNKYPCILNKEDYTIQMFQGSGLYQVSYIEWNFGDGSPLIRQEYVNGTTQYTASHKYKKVGKRTVTITPYRANGTAITDEIIIEEVNVRYCHLIINSATSDKFIKKD